MTVEQVRTSRAQRQAQTREKLIAVARELFLDLFAELADILPADGIDNTLAAHPAEHGKDARGAWLAGGNERGKRLAEALDVANGLLRLAFAGDHQVLETHHVVVVQVDGIDRQLGGR